MLALATAVAGCAPRWDPQASAATRVALADLPGQKLSDASPHVLPWQRSVLFFLCRWTTRDPIPVGIAADATPAERETLEAALRAWEGAGLGVRFVEVERSRASIDVGFEEGLVVSPSGPQYGNTIADCLVDSAALGASPGAAIDAQLVYASIRLARRSAKDALGREPPLSPDLSLGVALHELAHALGLQGHPGGSRSVLTRSEEALETLGRRVRADGTLREPTLEALYRLPSGTLVRRAEVSAARTDLVDRIARLAGAHGLAGPFTRVGDTSARIFWRTQGGEEYGLQVADVERALRHPARMVVLPEARTRRALPRSRDLR